MRISKYFSCGKATYFEENSEKGWPSLDYAHDALLCIAPDLLRTVSPECSSLELIY